MEEKNILKEHIRNIVKQTIRTLCGTEPVFPSQPLKRYPSKLEIVMKKDLNEGLIRTYPMDWVEKYLSTRFNSDFVKGGVDDEVMHFWFILKKDSESIEPLKEKMSSFGYFCSVEDDVAEGVYLQFEPKYDEYKTGEELSSRNNDEIFFYHVTPLFLAKKIKVSGLVPKSKNEFLNYPDRVYLTLADDGKEAAYEMADMLYTNSGNKMNDGKYCLIGVTLNGLEKAKFYPDWNVSHTTAYFTYDNIPPQNLKFLGTFEAQKA